MKLLFGVGTLATTIPFFAKAFSISGILLRKAITFAFFASLSMFFG